jgi:hypothetical protein
MINYQLFGVQKKLAPIKKKSPPVKAGGHLLLVLGYRKSSNT